jgi:hypothetical protein
MAMTTTTNHFPGSGSALCRDHTAMRHDKVPQCSGYSTSQDEKWREKKTQQEFQREPITVQWFSRNYCLQATTVVVVVNVNVGRVLELAGVRQQGARGAVPVCVSAPP